MVRSDKIDLVNDLAEKLGTAQSVIMADFCGLTVEQMNNLRTKLRNKEVEFKVIKNRLGKLALEKAECDELGDVLIGNTAWAFGIKDAVDPAKVLSGFAKENEKLVIKGGLLDRKKIEVAMIAQLASLPSRDELLSKMANALMQPATMMASAMNASLTKFARAFNALAEKKEEAGESAG